MTKKIPTRTIDMGTDLEGIGTRGWWCCRNNGNIRTRQALLELVERDPRVLLTWQQCGIGTANHILAWLGLPLLEKRPHPDTLSRAITFLEKHGYQVISEQRRRRMV